RDFFNLLRSPIIKADKKDRIVEKIISGNTSEITRSFIRLLIRKGRESNLPEVTTAFINQYKTHKNIHTVRLVTARPLSEDMKNAIIQQIQSDAGMHNIELETSVDDKLIGGFVLHTGDKLIDASVAYHLNNLARQFESNDFIYKVR